VIFWNKAAEQLHGFSSRQALGRPLEELIAPAASRAGFAAALEAWFAEGRPIPPAEWESFHQDGSAVPVYATHVLLRNREDGPEVFGVELDLRERRRAALEQERLRAQFHQAQKMEAVGQLAGGVAHDFNNLLQVIYGFTNLAMNQLSPDSAVRHELKQVIRAGERAKRLVGQLLTFSRRQDLHPEPLEVDRVVREFLKLLKRVIGEQIEVRFEPGGQGVTICADRGQVEQVLMNLCLNARDAMRDGGTLTLATRAATLDSHFCELHGGGAPGRYVAVQVGDTGCGMNPEVQERLFEPFFTTKPVGQGTGLGLATVYGIVRQHRGLVEVRSVRGRGSVFSVYFPEAGPLAPAVESPETAPTRGGTETLLVVEDDTAVLHITRKLLEQAGYRVLVAGDGVEGLRVFEEHADRIALAILDVVMPRMGGRAAAEALARRRPGLPVIFTSGYDPEAAPPGASSRPHEVLIRKPFSPDELLRQIRAMLDARQP
jgi:PAS domain S-box-containing protein